MRMSKMKAAFTAVISTALVATSGPVAGAQVLGGLGGLGGGLGSGLGAATAPATGGLGGSNLGGLGKGDLTAPISAMSGVFDNGGLGTGKGQSSLGTVDGKEIPEGDYTVTEADERQIREMSGQAGETTQAVFDTAENLDTGLYSDALSAALATAGVDSELADKTGGSVDAALNGLSAVGNSEELSMLTSSIPTCGIALAGLASAAAVGGTGLAGAGLAGGGLTAATGGAGAIAAAPAAAASAAPAAMAAASMAAEAAPGLLGCSAAAGSVVRSAGLWLDVYENDPGAIQATDLMARISPDSEMGQLVLDQAEDPEEREQLQSTMEAAHRMGMSLSKLKFGSTVESYGLAVRKASNGDIAAAAAILPATIRLGTQVVSATVDGAGVGESSDTSTLLGQIVNADASGIPILSDLLGGASPLSGTTGSKSDGSVETIVSDVESSSGDFDEDASSSSEPDIGVDEDDLDDDGDSRSSSSSSRSGSSSTVKKSDFDEDVSTSRDDDED